VRLNSGMKVWVALVRDCRNFGWIRTVVVMLLIYTATYCLVCPQTMPCFPPCLGWFMMFMLYTRSPQLLLKVHRRHKTVGATAKIDTNDH
jgi:hypothetical protein